MKIAQGAEAIVSREGGHVVKNRFEKKYRHPELDKNLRKYRTRREAKILKKLEELNFPAARVIGIDEDKGILKITFIKGEPVKNILHKDHRKLSREIGKKVATLHKHNIIHGDLTTSNMILDREIVFIDFGLGFSSEREEDKAVDLHLVRQALESKHYKIWEECFEEVIKGYKEHYPEHKKVLKRFEIVESRGRNKH